MSIRRPITCLALCAATLASFDPRPAQAGPLLDWLFGYNRAAPAYPVGQPVPVGTAGNMQVANMPVTGMPATVMPVTSVPIAGAPTLSYGAGYGAGYGATYGAGYGAGTPIAPVPLSGYPASGYAANYGNYYGSRMPVVGPTGYGYQAAQPNGIAAATAPTIMSYVPDYRTVQNRAAVTYYRPLMTTDPNTGAQVVALAPCTSYEYQAQRVPTFGYNGVLGSYATPPVVPPAPSMPTYTLPSGGVPLAAGSAPAVLTPNSGSYAMGYGGYSAVPSYSAPINTAPINTAPTYSSNYGAYSPQTGLTAPTVGNYPTQPITGSPGYYGSVTGGSTGGCTGSYPAPTYSTPGLTAPQGPSSLQGPSVLGPAPLPSTQYQAPLPSNSYPAPSFPVNPPSGLSDPSGDVPPVLPPNLGASNSAGERSQLRAIVRQPMTANNSLNATSNPLDSARTNQQVQQPTAPRESTSPALEPIPVPANMQQQPRWNPGLLKAEDRTALRPATPSNSQLSADYAGQAKTIQWASFHGAADNNASQAVQPATANRPSNQLDFSSSADQPQRSTSSGLRPIAPSPTQQQPATLQPAPQQPEPPRAPASRPARQTGGWSVVK